VVFLTKECLFHTSQSLAKMLELKLLLQTSKKGGLSCSQYLQHMQSLTDRLRSIGSEISDQDLVLFTLQSLRLDFENFITAISLRHQPLTMSELQSLLLAHEARLLANLRSIQTQAVHLTTPKSNISSQLPVSQSVSNTISDPNGSFCRYTS
jgi:gag-polypeptide of LTR copia-type